MREEENAERPRDLKKPATDYISFEMNYISSEMNSIHFEIACRLSNTIGMIGYLVKTPRKLTSTMASQKRASSKIVIHHDDVANSLDTRHADSPPSVGTRSKIKLIVSKLT